MKLLICNFKENKTLKEILEYKQMIETLNFSRTRLVLCPSFPFLPIMHSPKYRIGAQDVSMFENGSYTGEVSAEALKSIDVKYVIIGHHERENYFLENEISQKAKIKNALKHNLRIVLPVGENLMEYQLDKTMEVIDQKLKSLLLDIPIYQRKNIIIAYEPIWKIGETKALEKNEILKIIRQIKQWLFEHQYPNIPVLYGGGVSLKDINELKEIDGFLLGKVSQNVKNMCQILESF